MTATLDIDLSDVAFWQRPPEERMAAFARLRRLDRPMFFRENRIPFIPHGRGYHALVRHTDVVAASRDPGVFSSEPTASSVPDMPRWLAVHFGSMINMDDPRHARLRRIVSRAFTPRMLGKMEEDLRRAAAEIVAEAPPEGDFVTQVAARLPVRITCDMMGIPPGWRDEVLHRTNLILGHMDAEYTGLRPEFGRVNIARGLAKLLAAGHALSRMARRLGRVRRAAPTDDLTSRLVNGDEPLTQQELGAFFILLVVAGSETTRNAIAHGLKLLTDHPEQRALLLGDFDRHIPGTVEEIVRHSSPVIQFRRTVTRDHEMNGHSYRKGDKVLLFYGSANRDEDVFTDPDAFDITRDPNPHVGFGGPGPHHCLGAHLARREITVLFRELFARWPRLRAAGEPEYLLSNFINGVKHLPYAT